MRHVMRLIKHLNWTHAIRQIALIVFLWQFVRWFEHYWLPETASLVYAGLSFVFLTELILYRLSLWLRLLVQFAGLAAIVLLALPWNSDMLVLESWSGFVATIGPFASQFFPYVWFVLAQWAAYLAVNKLLNTREQVFMATVLSVIAFAITDSYSTIYLWDETSLVVISGLILMINRHFAEFRTKHPHTWNHISDYPWGIAFTAGTLVAFIILMGSISPNVRPLLVDPYTAWNQLQGKSVNFSVKEDTQTAIASFGLNLVSTSGYGRDDSQLGGGFNYNYDPVFEVTSRVRSYWRGESKSIYSGSGWVNPESVPERESFGLQQDIVPEVPVDESVPLNEFTQHFVFRDEKEPPKIFGAYPISRIESVNGSEEYAEVFEKNMLTGAIDPVSDEEPIRSYKVTSSVPVASAEMLMAAPETELVEENRLYLQLPETLPQRVYDLVEDITAEAETPYEKVKAIETYLRTNYAYTNTPDESLGMSEDFVDRFLFEVMEGYCDYFSTAMAVMVRTLDIPSRWVKGYTTGVMDEESSMIYEQQLLISGGETPEFEATYVVRNADAHSWVEVYFEGYGWVMFEPTAGFTAPVISAPAEETPIVIDSVVEEGMATDSEESNVSSVNYSAMILLIVFLIVIVVIAGWLLVRRQGTRFMDLRRLMVRFGLMRPPANPNEQMIKDFNRLLQYFKRKGLVREEYQTVREAAEQWAVRYPSVDNMLREVLYEFEQAKYSSRSFTPQEVEKYQASLRELRQKVKEIA